MGTIIQAAAWRFRRHSPALAIRWMGVAVLISIACAWVASLPVAPLLASALSLGDDRAQPSIERLSSPPAWSDTLIVRISASDTGVQQRFARVAWAQPQPQGYSRVYHVEFLIVADGRPHSYVLPIGANPEWNGNVEQIRVALQQIKGLRLQHADMQLIRRSPWALDMLVGAALAPYLLAPIPWPSLVVCVTVLLIAGIALCWPASHWRRRLRVAGLLVGGMTASATLIGLLSVVSTLYQVYGTLDEATAVRGVPAYDTSSEINQALLQAADRLPDGPILIETHDPTSYLARRAEFVFYPRQVDVIQATSATALQRQLANGYVGLLSDRVPPDQQLPGWERVSARDDAMAIWKRAGMAAHQPLAAPGRWAGLGLLLGLGLVLGVGWGFAGTFGVNPGSAIAHAWPFGVSLLAWWMFSLDLTGIAWAWSTIGVPLVIGAGLLIYGAHAARQRRTQRQAPAFKRPVGFAICGALAIVVLIALTSLRAILLPFSDYDTWWVWGMRGRGFYIDRALAPMLQAYGRERYPPAQSLVQTWGYIAMGGISERSIKILFPIWYASCLGLVWTACRAWHSRTNAMLWTLLLAATPIFLDHATLGNADLPLAVGLLSGSILLCCWLETTSPGLLIAAAFSYGGAAWIKFDGALLGMALLLAAVLIKVVVLRDRPKMIMSIAPASLCAVGILAALTLAWHTYSQTFQHLSTIPGLNALQETGTDLHPRGVILTFEELVFSHSNSTWSLLGSGYGALWLICAAALIAGWRRLINDPVLCFLAIATGVGMGLHLVFYTVVLSPAPNEYMYSVERYLLHIAPIAVLAAARATRPAQDRATSQLEQSLVASNQYSPNLPRGDRVSHINERHELSTGYRT